jgi:SAM-dependent MidA family methyltransferase
MSKDWVTRSKPCKRHAYSDPLAEPGEADLTFHVNFAALSTAAQDKSARVSGPMTQGAFLRALGIQVRAERLKQSAPELACDIDAAVARLTQPVPQMGTLFKVMGLAAPDSPSLPASHLDRNDAMEPFAALPRS